MPLKAAGDLNVGKFEAVGAREGGLHLVSELLVIVWFGTGALDGLLLAARE
ncbi:MAG: hypothetical protein ABI233_01775 [Chthoniobacterales bacterium]